MNRMDRTYLLNSMLAEWEETLPPAVLRGMDPNIRSIVASAFNAGFNKAETICAQRIRGLAYTLENKGGED